MADVFISHSSKDSEIADIICNSLEERGIKCWIAPRDIKGGEDWSAAITDAIAEAKVFIVVYSRNSLQSTQVPREIALADSAHAHIIPYKVDDTELSSSFKYYLTSNHWVNAQAAADNNIDGLFSAVSSALGINESPKVTVNNVVINMKTVNQSFNAPPSPEPVKAVPAPTTSAPSGKTLKVVCISAAAVVLVAAAVILTLVFTRGGEPARPDVLGGQEVVMAAPDDKPADLDIPPQEGAETIFSPGDIEPYENNGAVIYSNDQNNSFMVLGEAQNTGILLNAGDGSCIMYANPGYDKLRFTVARIDNTDRGENTIRVFLDDKEQKLIQGTPSFMPQELAYDISGVKQIKIAIDQNFGTRASYALMDISFSRNGAVQQEKPQPKTSADVSYSPADKQPYENKDAQLLCNDMNNTFTVLREQYNNGILLNAGDGSYVIYDNTEGFEELRFTLARIDNTDRGENKLRVFLDGVEQKIIDMNSDYMPQEFTYELTGVKQIKIAIDQNFGTRATYALMDVCFTKNGAEPQFSQKEVNAPDIAHSPADKLPYENKDAKLFANDLNNTFIVLGESFNNGILLNAGDGSCIIYDNAEGYEKLRFTLARIDNTERGENKLRVYLDGAEQKLIEMDSEYMPQEFTYDLTGVKQVKIAIDQNFGTRASYALMDVYFTKNGAEPEREAVVIESPDVAEAPVEKQPYENKDALIYANDLNNTFTVLGKSYDTGIVLNAGNASKVIFTNKEGYNRLSFGISKTDDTDNGENKVMVYIDRVPQQAIILSGGAALTTREYDISGSSQIVICVEQNFGSRADIALVDMKFSK